MVSLIIYVRQLTVLIQYPLLKTIKLLNNGMLRQEEEKSVYDKKGIQ
jgi:hypothetical protein